MKKIKSSILCVFLLNGCSSLAPEIPTSDSGIPGQWGKTGEVQQFNQLKMSQVFPASSIRDDVNLALEHNKEIKKASLTALKAKQLISSVEGPFNVTGSINGDYRGDVKACCVFSRQTYGLLGISYEIDLWGRIKSMTEAAKANSESQDLLMKSVQNAIASEIIRSHLVIAYSNQHEVTINKMNDVLFELEKKARLRVQSGLPDKENLSRILLKKENLQMNRNRNEQEKSSAIESLRILTSYKKNQFQFFSTIDEMKPTSYSIPETTSSGIILNRPDIAALKKKMIASNHEIGVAKAERKPKILLPVNLLALVEGGTLFQVLPSITQSIFGGDKKKADKEVSITSRDIAQTEFEIGIQSAFRDIANGLKNDEALKNQIISGTESTKLAQEAFDRTKNRNDAGYDSLSDLIDRFDDLYSAQSQFDHLELERMKNSISLWSAVGAGV